MKPLDRSQFVARKLGKLNNKIVLDIGCRDQIFKKSLQGNFEYIGIDYDQENKNTEYWNNFVILWKRKQTSGKCRML